MDIYAVGWKAEQELLKIVQMELTEWGYCLSLKSSIADINKERKKNNNL